MFKFDFEIEEDDLDNSVAQASTSKESRAASQQDYPSAAGEQEECHTVSLEDLLDQLPSTISYSPLTVPFLDKPLLRRDLYDARFQLAASSQPTDRDRQAGDEYVDAKSDLIKGVYEGGLKTWEGGVDLVEVLSEIKGVAAWCRGSFVLEAGCGTAMPTAFLLRSLLDSTTASESSPTTTLHLQDFNLPVLALVTLPNLILASLDHIPSEALEPASAVPDVEDSRADDEAEGALSITTDMKEAFKTLLRERRIELQFTYGHWGALAERIEQDGERYELVLTAETIYEETSVPSLLRLLRAASKQASRRPSESHQVKMQSQANGDLEHGVGALDLGSKWSLTALQEQEEPVVLVAAKVLYFGVGGDLQSFLSLASQQGGWHESIKEWTKGVGRKVVRIGWQ